MANRIKRYAKKTFLALDNRYNSVKKVYPNSIDYISEENGFYLGVKEVRVIPESFITELNQLGYIYHTVDKASLSGRAIDLELINPLTGNYMTGSSSGTALNVFLGINDVGIGTDGGGSVLAPAICLNLYGFIHPRLGKKHQVNEELKVSTDGIPFSPSIGLISKELDHITKIMTKFFEISSLPNISIGIDNKALQEAAKLTENEYRSTLIGMDDKYTKDRRGLIVDLEHYLSTFDLVISKEGPVDLNGVGDSIYGHFSDFTKKKQNIANKGFIRVANMVGAITLTVPSSDLSVGYVLMTKKESVIPHFLIIGKLLSSGTDELVNRYFGDLSKYFELGI
ncbi:amidase family protein [Vagococcus bubulae]|uniref:Amidase domain-containing protein n=1 Tax=Vagococcus bubulae TaxID=1977868 RepID=A0A429ZFK5_9ENTE|nr:amidase family protein [Vagococcus bubulae]RST92449.1 hypothetical protein CBF36_08760 [Vagococcus bubulae]